ncbi:MAG: orotidine-5'-phosphate decarboxylase [Methanomassiliicoccales archaeon]|nr:orotidine-5'-phosphate decarboxylase [Methanomassiliicoccales archaeon]
MKKGTRVVLALDVTDEAKAISVAGSVKDLVAAIKVNWPLVLATSPQIVTRLARLAPVVCDFKVADIPNTNRLIAEQVAKLGASGLIVQGFPGRDSVRACIEAAKGVEVFVVTEMSHPGGAEFTGPVADRMAQIAKEEGAAGIIAPATRPERIRELRAIVGNLLILSPGIGAQGGSAAEALRNGADLVIAGRSIYQSPDPRGAAERLVEEVRRSGV